MCRALGEGGNVGGSLDDEITDPEVNILEGEMSGRCRKIPWGWENRGCVSVCVCFREKFSFFVRSSYGNVRLVSISWKFSILCESSEMNMWKLRVFFGLCGIFFMKRICEVTWNVRILKCYLSKRSRFSFEMRKWKVLSNI